MADEYGVTLYGFRAKSREVLETEMQDSAKILFVGPMEKNRI